MTLRIIFLVFVGFTSFTMRSQADCLLGVGITQNDSLADIFQMNNYQRKELVNLSAELKYRNDILNVQLENIYNRHPQNTVEELNQLALKYRDVMDSMRSIQSMIDKKVLSILNPKQYQLYLDLCQEASRSPFLITPKVYADSIPVKQK